MRGLLRCATADRHQPHPLQDTLVGRPRVNIQNDKGKAKAYQVKQVLLAIDKLRGLRHED